MKKQHIYMNSMENIIVENALPFQESLSKTNG